jgi:hypothetical protein
VVGLEVWVADDDLVGACARGAAGVRRVASALTARAWHAPLIASAGTGAPPPCACEIAGDMSLHHQTHTHTHARARAHTHTVPATRLVGVLEELARDDLHLLGPGGRPQQRLAVGADLVHDLADLRQRAAPHRGGMHAAASVGWRARRGRQMCRARGAVPVRPRRPTHASRARRRGAQRQRTCGSKPMSSMRSASSSTR